MDRTGASSRFRRNFRSFRDVRLFARIFIFITLLPVLFRVMSIPGLMNRMSGSRRPMSLDSSRIEEEIARVVKYVDYILGRDIWIYRRTCLKRSLALYRFLSELGMDLKICLGVRFSEKGPALADGAAARELEGHAWLISAGRVFLEKDASLAQSYSTTYTFPPGEPAPFALNHPEHPPPNARARREVVRQDIPC